MRTKLLNQLRLLLNFVHSLLLSLKLAWLTFKIESKLSVMRNTQATTKIRKPVDVFYFKSGGNVYLQTTLHDPHLANVLCREPMLHYDQYGKPRLSNFLTLTELHYFSVILS